MGAARVFALSAACLLALSCSSGDPASIDGHEVLEFAEQEANPSHVSEDVDYEQTPGLSGPHNEASIPCEPIETPVAEELMVHTLEHGAIGILFDPAVPPDEQEAIEEYAAEATAKVFSAPFDGLQEPVTVISWRRMMPLESFDAGAVDEYVSRYEDDAPEKGIPC